MSVTDDFRAIVGRLRGWGFTIVEWSGCYGRSNGTSWSGGRPDGMVEHHYVCSLSSSQDYIDGLVGNLAAGSVVNWFGDVNGKGYLIGTGPMNHSGTGNSSVLDLVRADRPPPGPATSSGDMSGNQALAGIECQHPGDSTPWPGPLLDVMVAITAAECLQWNWTANRAINHYEWTNRKIDMSAGGGPSDLWAGQELRRRVAARMSGTGTGDEFDMASLDDLKKAVREVLREDDMVSYDATNQGTGAVENRKVSVVKGIGDGATYAGRAARAAQLANDSH